MKVEITPSLLKGEGDRPSLRQKALPHRKIICAALATGISRIENLEHVKGYFGDNRGYESARGAEISVKRKQRCVKGIENPRKKAEIDCGESGSTLRFLIPVVCAPGSEYTLYRQRKTSSKTYNPISFRTFKKRNNL